jgi:polysaccharide biosynthesis/export protein
MKTKATLYQLLLERVGRANRFGAIALSLFFVIASTPVNAQEQTIELEDVNSTESPRTNPRELPAELPQLKPRELSPTTPPNATTPPGSSSDFATAETDYTLGAGDLIALNIFQVEEYSSQYPVLVDGTINLPLVGSVNVSGLTLKETSEAVSKKYATYLKRPIVTVGLVTPRPLKIGVSGEIDNPGTYEIAPTGENQKFPTVTDLITKAGGITTIADVRNVRVTRNIQGKEVVFNSNLWALLNESNIRQDISLRDGDTIFVPTSNEINTAELSRLSEASFGLQSNQPIKIAVVGEVYRPGSHTIQPEQLGRDNNNTDKPESSPPRLTQALTAANGIKPLADVRKVEVRRTAWDGTEKLIAVDLWELLQSGDTNQDVILQKGDKIVVPQAEAQAKEDSEQIAAASFNRESITVNVVGEVTTPGAQQVPPNTPLNQAILAAGGFDTTRADQSKVELVRLNPNGTVDKRQVEIDLAAGIDDEQNPILRHNDVVVVGRSGVTKTGDGLGQVFSPLGGIFSVFRFLF